MCCISSLVPCQCVCVHGKQPGHVSYTPQGCVCVCVCVCACVFNPTAASMASLRSARRCLWTSVSASLSPRSGPPLLVSSPPLLFSSPSSSSVFPLFCLPPPLWPLHTLDPFASIFSPSEVSIYIFQQQPLLHNRLSLPLSLGVSSLFYVSTKPLSLTLTFPPLPLVYLILFSSPCFHLRRDFLYSDCSLAFPWISLFLISLSVFQTL